MGKRHSKQNSKQAKGQFFTSNVDYILYGYEDIVRGKDMIDPFAGGKDLISWSVDNGATSAIGYDIEPLFDDIIYNDSLMNPPSYVDKVLVSNPPYLSKNKCKVDKTVFSKWDANDYYKCHLQSLIVNGAEEAILIIPSNFLCEGRSKARANLFKHYYAVKAKFWNEPTFEDATVGVCVLHMKLGTRQYQAFPLSIMPANITIDVELLEKNGYLYGNDFYDYIRDITPIRIIKTDIGMTEPNTNIVVGLLDGGSWKCGISYNDKGPIYSKPKSFTTYQITTPDYNISIDNQKLIVEIFNEKFDKFREQYYSMFLSNYMGARQKILSRSYVHKFISRIIKDELKLKKNEPITNLTQFLFENKVK